MSETETIETADDQPAAWTDKVHDWVVDHDDSWLFTISYVSLAVVLSIWISLFWLVVVVGIHYAFEWVRHRRQHDSRWMIAATAMWHVKLDLVLIVFALCLTAYMDVLMGVAGLGGAARLGLQSGARLGGWARALRGILLSLDDAAQVARVAAAKLARSSNGQVDDELAAADLPAPQQPPWYRWSWGDHVTIWFGAFCLILIVLAPWLTDKTAVEVCWELLMDLHPFPPSDEAD